MQPHISFSTTELQEAALRGDVLAQWRLSQRMEKNILFQSNRGNLRNPPTSVFINKSSENQPFTHYKHLTCASQSLDRTYQPPSNLSPSIPCSHTFSFAHGGLVPVDSSRQKTRPEENLKSVSSSLNSASQVFFT